MEATPDLAASQVLEVVPFVMRAIRNQMRQQTAPSLSLPQFRVLGFLDRNPGASLSDVAEYIGVTLPSMSKMVDGLVTEKWVTREFQPEDRRRATCALTPRGRALLESAQNSALAYLADVLHAVPASQRETIVQAMKILHPLFSSEHEIVRVR